jgi:CO/xanthine dehydrogenase Mo-binding subunit
MNAPHTRRTFLAGTGALVIAFSTHNALAQEATPAPGAAPPVPKPPGDLSKYPKLDSWIRLEANGHVTVFAGKAELGTGVKTAFIQCAAEELDLPASSITMITADTALTTDEGYTAGSHSMQDCGTAIRYAAADLHAMLIELAAARLSVSAADLKSANGVITAPDARKVSYGELVDGLDQHRDFRGQTKVKPSSTLAIIGKPFDRVDIPGKLTGEPMYVQDMRPDGMLHARVVRPPGYGAKLASVDTAAVEKLPGVVKVVRDGSFLAVVAAREHQAILAMHVLEDAARWDDQTKLPKQSDIHAVLRALPHDDTTILNRGVIGQPGVKALKASYSRQYQSHASIGPSCALALMDGDKLTVWSHGQGMFPLRSALSKLLAMPPEQIRCIHTEGSGCYGHNGADDSAADAALIARALPGKPIRVQLMREQEHGWEPFGPAMSTNVSAALDADGKLIDWQYEVWSNTHSMRPGGAGNLLAGQQLATPFPPDKPMPIPQPEGGGDRNSIPLYVLPNARVISRFIPGMPIRVSALRGLGAYMNVFSIESFMDEMADAANADPVEFRLKHLEDPRARDVVAKAAQEFGWQPNAKLPRGHGQGFAFARYKNLGAYCAVAMNVSVDRQSGIIKIGKVVAAVDSGQAVNHDGIRNQIEGAIVQSASWTLLEEVTFSSTEITSRDWSSYPILRFPDVPDSVDVHIIDRPDMPFLGTGEAGQGPTGAAIANAVKRATGVRIRDLPLNPAKVKAAIGV